MIFIPRPALHTPHFINPPAFLFFLWFAGIEHHAIAGLERAFEFQHDRVAQNFGDFAEEHAIPYKLCGKFIVATAPEEFKRMQTLWANGTANGAKDLRLLDAGGIRQGRPGLGVSCG